MRALARRIARSAGGEHRAVIWTLLAYGAIWAAYRTIATLPRDIHADVSELYGLVARAGVRL
ncbi:MAG: hypothetical protein MZV49_11670 [Rhodopseudomonas palustris]|nr:hypothetical protein [Rhodopseudomonas palustris]